MSSCLAAANDSDSYASVMLVAISSLDTLSLASLYSIHDSILLRARTRHLPDSVHQAVHEEGIVRRRYVGLGADDLVVAALHQILLEVHRMLHERRALALSVHQLELRVELGDAVLGQEMQQVEAEDRVLPLRCR